MSTAADAIRTAARIYRDASMTERVAAKCRLVVEFDPAADAIVYDRESGECRLHSAIGFRHP